MPQLVPNQARLPLSLFTISEAASTVVYNSFSMYDLTHQLLSRDDRSAKRKENPSNFC